MNLAWSCLKSGRGIQHHQNVETNHHTWLFSNLILAWENRCLKQLCQEILHQFLPSDFFLREKKAVLNQCPALLFSQCLYRFYWRFLQFRRRDHNVCLKTENIHKLEGCSWRGDRSHSQNGCSTQWETCPCCCIPSVLLWLRLALRAR